MGNNCCKNDEKAEDQQFQIRNNQPTNVPKAETAAPIQPNNLHIPAAGGRSKGQKVPAMNRMHPKTQEVHSRLGKREDTLSYKYSHLPIGGVFRYPDGSTYQGNRSGARLIVQASLKMSSGLVSEPASSMMARSTRVTGTLTREMATEGTSAQMAMFMMGISRRTTGKEKER